MPKMLLLWICEKYSWKKKIFVLKSLVAFKKDNIAVRSPKYHYPQLLFWWILERSRSRCLQTYAANVKISSFLRMKPISFLRSINVLWQALHENQTARLFLFSSEIQYLTFSYWKLGICDKYFNLKLLLEKWYLLVSDFVLLKTCLNMCHNAKCTIKNSFALPSKLNLKDTRLKVKITLKSTIQVFKLRYLGKTNEVKITQLKIFPKRYSRWKILRLSI